jgi:molybdate transport system substrate-binding protein
MRRARSVVVALGMTIALLTACGGGSGDNAGGGGSGSSGEPKITGTVTVFAASSLTEVFTALGKEFERRHSGTKVQFSFGASSDLGEQITSGAPADVFASASPDTMATVTDAGDAKGKPVTFVRNRLEIAVPKANPAHVTKLSDFAKPALKIALCAPEVPCGSAAVKAFQIAGITPKPDTLEADVKAALQKVALGEVDAALVYRTDVKAAGDKVEGIDFPEAAKAINDYPIVALSGGSNAAAARAFIALVLSSQGRARLDAAGFMRP